VWIWDEERPCGWMWQRESDRANASGRIHGFQVYEPGGGTQGPGKTVVGMTRGCDVVARDRYVMRLRGFGVSGIQDSRVRDAQIPCLRDLRWRRNFEGV
jgi:hypothetical protein